jgi:hypothetical protein
MNRHVVAAEGKNGEETGRMIDERDTEDPREIISFIRTVEGIARPTDSR